MSQQNSVNSHNSSQGDVLGDGEGNAEGESAGDSDGDSEGDSDSDPVGEPDGDSDDRVTNDAEFKAMLKLPIWFRGVSTEMFLFHSMLHTSGLFEML